MSVRVHGKGVALPNNTGAARPCVGTLSSRGPPGARGRQLCSQENKARGQGRSPKANPAEHYSVTTKRTWLLHSWSGLVHDAIMK